MPPSRSDWVAGIFATAKVPITDEAVKQLAKWPEWAIERILARMSAGELAVLAANPHYQPRSNNFAGLETLKVQNLRILESIKEAVLPSYWQYYLSHAELQEAIASGELIPPPISVVANELIRIPQWLGTLLQTVYAEWRELEIAQHIIVSSGIRSVDEQKTLSQLGFVATMYGAQNLHMEGYGGVNLALNNPFYEDVFLPQLRQSGVEKVMLSGQRVTLQGLRTHGAIEDGSQLAKVVDGMLNITEHQVQVVDLTACLSTANRISPLLQVRRIPTESD